MDILLMHKEFWWVDHILLNVRDSLPHLHALLEIVYHFMTCTVRNPGNVQSTLPQAVHKQRICTCVEQHNRHLCILSTD